MAEPATKKSKRRVKDPETFRERALKTTESSDRPEKRQRIRDYVVQRTGSALRPIGKTLRVVFYRQPFLLLRRPLRLLAKLLLVSYIVNSWRELKQVNWPNWRQSRQLTLAVVLFAAIFGAIISLLDYGLDKLFRQILLK